MRSQQARSNCFHICQGAGQLVFCNKSTFEPEGVKIHEEIQGTPMQDIFGLKYFLFKARFRRPPKEGNSTYNDSEEARRCQAAIGPAPESRRGK